MRKLRKRLGLQLSAEPRFGLLFLMLLLALAVPFFLPRGILFQLTYQFLISAVLLVGLASVSRGRRQLLIGTAIAVPAVTLNWLAHLVNHTLIVWSGALAVILLLYLAALILIYLGKAKRANSNTIYGAVCVYMLLGFIWGLAFFLAEAIDPHSLAEGGAPVYENIGGLLEVTSEAMYLSFVTLTTLGYGDVTPISGPSRALAMLEAIIGQLFLIISISRLVGLSVAQSIREAETEAENAGPGRPRPPGQGGS